MGEEGVGEEVLEEKGAEGQKRRDQDDETGYGEDDAGGDHHHHHHKALVGKAQRNR